MRTLSPALAALLAAQSVSAQIVSEAAAAGSASSAAGAAVTAVPALVSAPALAPSLAPGLNSALAPAAAPRPDATAPALAPSLITPIVAAALPEKGKHYSPEEWGRLVTGAKDEGTRAVLRSMRGDMPGDPQLSVTLADGEKVDGSFRGLAGGKLVFESAGKLLGIAPDAGNITEVRRRVDVIFDGATIRPDEVVVHDRPPLINPFKDLSAYLGRVVEMDVRDLDDLKYSAQTVSGRIVKADGEDVELASAKGVTYLKRRYHRIDSVALRTDHYSSYGQIASIDAVEGKVPHGAAVELVLNGGAKVRGRFYGVRKDAEGSFVLIETDSAGGTAFRAYRDFHDLRTPGYDEGELVAGSEPLVLVPPK